MRSFSAAAAVLTVILCSRSSPQVTSAPAESAQIPVRLSADTPRTTVLGNNFIAPAEWSIHAKGAAVIVEAPEGNSSIGLIDVQAKTPDDALAAAWQVYNPQAKWPIKVSQDLPDKDGWSRRHSYEYLTSPNEQRGVAALV